jgi:hypothetical protein
VNRAHRRLPTVAEQVFLARWPRTSASVTTGLFGNDDGDTTSTRQDCCPRAVEVTNRSSSGLNDHYPGGVDLDGCRFNLGYAVRSTDATKTNPSR